MSPTALLALVLLGQSDAGYTRERTADGQHCLRWPARAFTPADLTFVQSATGDYRLGPAYFDAVSRAEGTWAAEAGTCASLQLLEGARTDSRSTGYVPGGRNENLIVVRTLQCFQVVPDGDPCRSDDSCGNRYDCWDHGDGILAITLLTHDARGQLLDADIEINGVISYLTLVDSPPCQPGHVSQGCVGNDVQNTVTHELGHALGLAHSPDPASTMYATARLGETSKRVLDPTSRQFVCDVYPRGKAALDCLAPDGGPGPDDPGGGTIGSGPGGASSPGIAPTGAACSGSGQTGTSEIALLLALAALALTRVRLWDGPSCARRPPPRPNARGRAETGVNPGA